MSKPDRQTRLPLTREERFGALAAIDRGRLAIDGKPVGRPRWANVVDLLQQIELRSDRDGCHAYVETLAARMKNKVGVSRSTLIRTAEAAEALGLLTIEARHNGHHQQSNRWVVEWSRVAKLAAEHGGKSDTLPPKSDTLVGAAARPKSDTPAPQNDTPGCQNDTLLRGIVRPVVRPSVLGRPRATGDFEDAAARAAAVTAARRALARGGALEPAAGLALRFGRRVREAGGRRPERGDVELCWKLAAIAGVLGERWLWSIAEGLARVEKRPDNPWAWVQTAADRGSYEAPGPGRELMRALLARSPPPPADWPASAARLDRRLCVAEE